MPIATSTISLEPFIKWAGGKRQLVERLEERLPKSFNTYYEPFLGGGAFLFHVKPENAIINDINKELMHVYRTVRDSVDDLIAALKKIDESANGVSKEYYYFIREEFNRKIQQSAYDVEMAAMFIYINKHCFNGLYRVNRKGLFNVPYNNTGGLSFNKNNLLAVSDYLARATILCGDFESACVDINRDDFVFFDSPYASLNPTSFESYTKDGFAIEEHKRLAILFRKLTEKGCLCMLTNHNTELIRELYADYFIEEVSVKRFINSDASNRVGKEVIIRNYQ